MYIQNPSSQSQSWSCNEYNEASGDPRGRIGGILTQRGEEPAVLATSVPLLERLLDRLLGLFPLADFLEGICREDTLQAFELERVAGWHQVVVVDRLDEWLDLGSLRLARLGHATCDGRWVALNAGDECVCVWVRLGTRVLRLDYDNLAG